MIEVPPLSTRRRLAGPAEGTTDPVDAVAIRPDHRPRTKPAVAAVDGGADRRPRLPFDCLRLPANRSLTRHEG
jgi:hypothetical protein